MWRLRYRRFWTLGFIHITMHLSLRTWRECVLSNLNLKKVLHLHLLINFFVFYPRRGNLLLRLEHPMILKLYYFGWCCFYSIWIMLVFGVLLGIWILYTLFYFSVVLDVSCVDFVIALCNIVIVWWLTGCWST
jgi:hypothetical protein